MARLLLIRHAENDWVRSGKLAGWTPEVHLNETGRQQADALGRRLADKKLTALYSSPLERAVETAQAIAAHHSDLQVTLDDGVGEVDFGDWTGKRLRQLSRTRLWRIVQGIPSRARFPGGERISAMQARVVDALDRIEHLHSNGLIVVVSHADVLKAAIAHYAGIHIDLFQRIEISPASISIIELGRYGPRVVRLNDTCHYNSLPGSGQSSAPSDTKG